MHVLLLYACRLDERRRRCAHPDGPVVAEVGVRQRHDLPLAVHQVRRLGDVRRLVQQRHRLLGAQVELVLTLQEQVLVIAL